MWPCTSPSNRRNTATRLALTSELRHAIGHGQLLLHYQPEVDVRRATFSRLEALVRWAHPQHGLLPPDEFIPLAERTGLIGPLTSWVLNEALAQCRSWQDESLPLGVAVNLSGRLLQDPGLVDLVRESLHRWRLDPSCLTLELTESSIMSDPDHAMNVLERLRALTVRLSIDDFGTGYSSLSHLRRLPVDEIKIDKSFVLEMLTNPADDAIVHSTIQLCHNLGRRVVAEGVENAQTYERLRELGCDFAQGFHLAQPMPSSDITLWIERSDWKVGK